MSTAATPEADPQQPATTTVTPGSPGMIVASRIYNLILAVLGTSALAISLFNSATNEQVASPLDGISFSLSYFTIWSNIFAFIVAWAIFANPRRDDKIFRWLRMTSLVMIVITGLIYAILLAPSANPCGSGIYTNTVFHYIVPWATLLGFLVFGPRPRFTGDLIWKMMLIPVIWLTYTLLHGLAMIQRPGDECAPSDKSDQWGPSESIGEAGNWYPYPFINPNYNDTGAPGEIIPGVTADGYTGIAINMVIVVILGLLFASIFYGLDRLLSKGEKPSELD